MKFYQLSPKKRREILEQEDITLNEIDEKSLESLNKLSENVIGQVRLPLGVCQNLIVNDKSYLVPMSIEEPSVVAAANNGARIFALNGGVKATSQRDGIYGQIVLRVDRNFDFKVFENTFDDAINQANQEFASLVRHGGGLKKISGHQENDLLFLYVLVDPAQAMGANKTNSILEYLSDLFLKENGIKEKLFAILSNYPSQFASAKVKIDPKTIGGQAVAEKIALLSEIGKKDVYRAVTNNKGIMNGVDSVLLATGNDFRGVEAATAVFSNESKSYESLSSWKFKDGELIGSLKLPLAIGSVGGSIKVRKDIQQSFSILKTNDVEELAEVIVAIGLANNLAALLAISTKGIQAGHMKLQARNLVDQLDASEAEKKQVLEEIIKLKDYSQATSQKVLKEIRKRGHYESRN